MNAFRYETASLIAADPRLALSTQFTTGSTPFPAIRVGVPCFNGRYTSISPDPRN